jgi:hypothetical protein
MAHEPLPDGVLKLAERLRERATNEPNAEIKESLLRNAEKFQNLDEQARSVIAESDELNSKVRNMHGGPIDHKSWVFWLVIAVGVGTFLLLFFIRQ